MATIHISILPLTTKIVQYSVLAPILFSLHINDPLSFNFNHMHNYGNDCTFHCSTKYTNRPQIIKVNLNRRSIFNFLFHKIQIILNYNNRGFMRNSLKILCVKHLLCVWNIFPKLFKFYSTNFPKWSLIWQTHSFLCLLN